MTQPEQGAEPNGALPDASVSNSETFVVAGRQAGKIDVHIGYRIIQLFSAGLYSSPNKAVEELVSNSFDAMATRADLLLDPSMSPDSSIWVVDDGESMDLDGLIDLWRIAESSKRVAPSSTRPPIGKFGIGKLATYVLARHLTYIACKNGRVLAVTMQYEGIKPDTSVREQELSLPVRELDRATLEAALQPARSMLGGQDMVDRLLAAYDKKQSWTAVVMSALTPLAGQLKLGRLRWILGNAMPNNDDFKLFLNGEQVVSKVADREPLFAWELGTAPRSVGAGAGGAELLKSLHQLPADQDAVQFQVSSDDDGPFVKAPDVPGQLRGYVEVYEDILSQGAAAKVGRSHGFFIRVRDRLINLDEPLFGVPALSHATFDRFRLVIDADELDRDLSTTREAVQQSPTVTALQAYLRSEFNTARRLLDTWRTRAAKEAQLSTKIGRTARALSRRPLVAAVQAVLDERIPRLVLSEVPVGLTDEEKQTLLEELATALDSEEGLVAAVEPGALGVEQFIARWDATTRVVTINVLHPFYANFVEEAKTEESFQLLAVTEVLTEAYMLEEGMPSAAVEQVLKRRDAFLRELVASRRRGAAAVADNLLECADNEKGLETALHESMECLGFEVTRLAQAGKPEGVAAAIVGAQQTGGVRADYSVTYDAKSTGNKAVAADHVAVSRLARHRKDYRAQYGLVVAPDFVGGSDPDSALNKEIKEDYVNGGRITALTVNQLAVLVQLAARRQLGYRRLRDLFETCRGPKDVEAWLKAEWERPEERPPLEEILQAVVDLQQVEGDSDPVHVAAVKLQLRNACTIDISQEELVEHLRAIKRLTGDYLFLDTASQTISVDTSVEKVLEALARHRSTVDRMTSRDYVMAMLRPADAPEAGQ